VSVILWSLATLGAEAGRLSGRQASFDQQLLSHRQDLLEQERRLRVLLEARGKSPPGKADVSRDAVARQELDHIYDRFYTLFEDTFRGSHDDIKGRVAIYVPYVVGAGAGTKIAPVLDIGCGRGEWLQLLKDRGLAGRGIDFNRSSVARCHELGLDVTMTDALDYLRAQKAESIGAVTAFHVAEHLPFPQILQLFDEVRRVLRPEGMFIMETPNPENLIVGACTFWNDPTHLQPLPPEPMRFVMENRGFTRVEILRLHPNTAIAPPGETESASLNAIAERGTFQVPADV
jgi:O-antigen chain-terminating methyltransferase